MPRNKCTIQREIVSEWRGLKLFFLHQLKLRCISKPDNCYCFFSAILRISLVQRRTRPELVLKCADGMFKNIN